MSALSVDGTLGKDTLAILINLSQLMAAKIDGLILHMQGYIGIWVSIAVARSYL